MGSRPVVYVLVCNKKFSPIKLIDFVGFSALLMVGINLAKNWCAKLISFFYFKLALLRKASENYKLNYPPLYMGVDCNLSLFKLSTSDKFLRQKYVVI